MSRQRDLIDMMESPLFHGFSEKECKEIHAFVKPARVSYRKKQTLLPQGEPVSQLSILTKGKVVGIRYYYGGDSHILRIFHPGEILSLEAAMSSFYKTPIAIFADEASETLSFSLQRLMSRHLLEEEVRMALRQNLLRILADENIRLIYKTEVLSQKVLRDRIMIFLRIMTEKKGKEAFFIGMNQDQFAQYLCVNRSSLSSELNAMRKEGLIDYRRDYYRILEKGRIIHIDGDTENNVIPEEEMGLALSE